VLEEMEAQEEGPREEREEGEEARPRRRVSFAKCSPVTRLPIISFIYYV
jgi:hypothetical protein